MECYYVDEVIELIEEDIEFHQENKLEASDEGYAMCQYTIGVLKHLLAKVKNLEVKEFNYQE